MRIVTCAATGACALALFAVAVAQPPPVFSDAILEQFPIARGDGTLIVPVTLNGKSYPFCLDTGATATAYDTSLRPLLGKAPCRKKTVSTGEGVDVVLEELSAPTAFLGKLPLPTTSTVFLADLSKMRQASGEDIYGILGLDFLSQYVVTLDFDQGHVAFRSLAPPNPGEPVPIQPRGPAAFVKARGAKGPPHLFLIDTGYLGFGSVLFPGDQYDALARDGKVQPAGSTHSSTLAGERARRVGRIESFTLGPFAHRDLLTSDSEMNVLGLNYWSRYLVTFDFPNGVVYLKKGAQFERRDNPDQSGLSLLRTNGATVVHSVEAGSPAARARIRAGDVLVEVDGKRADQGPLFPLRRLLAEEGRSVAVRLRRGKRELCVTLALRDWRKDEPVKKSASGAPSPRP